MLINLMYIFLVIAQLACGKGGEEVAPTGSTPAKMARRPASLGIVGDSTDVKKATQAGIVLMGGGTDVSAAFKWMIGRSGGGNVVVIRASGTDAYNDYVFGLGKVSSVETLKIDSRALANNDTVAHIIRNAEMLFIAGGDQSNYMDFWRGTKTEQAINYLLNEKKAPVGGTSAGCAVLSGVYFSGEYGGLTSDEALQNPYAPAVTLYNNDFIRAPFLADVIADQHYLARSREGRSVVFLARMLSDWQMDAKAIAVDERTAVAIDGEGIATVFGLYSSSRAYSYAYFLKADRARSPERMEAGQRLDWNADGKAIQVYEIQSSEDGNGKFDVASFDDSKASGGKAYWWGAIDGTLYKKEKTE